MKYLGSVVLGAGLSALLAGCSSIESTHVIRDQYGVDKGEKFDGIPIVVTVPDKLGFLVTESVYDVTREIEVAEGKLEPRTTRETVVHMSETPIPLGTSELFTMDLKRPASGTAKSNLKFTGFYPNEISNEVEDKTITDVTAAAAELGKFIKEAGETASAEGVRVLVSQRQYMLVYDPHTGRFEKQ